MENKYCNLIGTNKIKDEYTKINDGFAGVEDDVDASDTRMNLHVAGTAEKHSADDVTFASSHPTITATNTRGAVEQVDSRLENIIAGGSEDKDPEVVDARNSLEFGVFDTVKERLDHEEAMRSLADETLQENIDAEASTRAAADTTLGTLISNMTETAELTPLNGWGSPWGHPFRATRIETVVVIEGVISGGGTSSGTVITTLPPGFRPASERLGNVKQHENNEWVNVSIGADGNMAITSSHAWGAGVKILQFVYSLN